MARYELFRVEQFLNAQILELGLGEIDVTYVVVQKRDQNHPSSLNTYPDFFLVPNHGSTITPTRCLVIKSPITPEDLQQITMTMTSERDAVPRCNAMAEKLLQDLKDNYTRLH